MNEYTASNGMTLHVRGNMISTSPSGLGLLNLTSDLTAALREFFRAEEGERRGVWRSTKDATWTAVRRNTVVYFQNEDHERSFHVVVGNQASMKAWSRDLQRIAHEYFAAHPEPKPWHNAKPGEVWDVDLPAGGNRYVTVESDRFADHTVVFRDPHSVGEVELVDEYIIDARRVYPEVS